ncbi:helix-turn-helix transcriptional regulator [Vallitalea pronyensis]|uniref:Helix-turn-helix transcriptional regulator n=1 Tax=Vallitalea pronyensis TaxID=1348613 RepID=A0A8J8MJE5_9FIRM|nr:AraC family transcriptional regulator [Vallitalea pronyensis]QUI22745.1 helix-turn-helix transcriptional regulator [Vallitalea pronyensis]
MIDIGNDTFCRDTFEKLLTLSKSSSFTAKLAQKVKVMELLSYFFGHQKIDEISLNNTKQIDSMRKILKYIDTNYINNVTIDELAEHVFMHPNYFFRFFKKNTGETPIHYINNKRINKAKYILSTTKYTVDEVSKMVGFHDSSYFYRVFKKWVGITPIEYRLINTEEQ